MPLLVGGEWASFRLQQVDQYIIYYDKCNEMVKKAMGKTKDLVLPGMICGYEGTGKDSCQVSAQTLSCLGVEAVTAKLPHSRVAGPGLFTPSSLHP